MAVRLIEQVKTLRWERGELESRLSAEREKVAQLEERVGKGANDSKIRAKLESEKKEWLRHSHRLAKLKSEWEHKLRGVQHKMHQLSKESAGLKEKAGKATAYRERLKETTKQRDALVLAVHSLKSLQGRQEFREALLTKALAGDTGGVTELISNDLSFDDLYHQHLPPPAAAAAAAASASPSPRSYHHNSTAAAVAAATATAASQAAAAAADGPPPPSSPTRMGHTGRMAFGFDPGVEHYIDLRSSSQRVPPQPEQLVIQQQQQQQQQHPYRPLQRRQHVYGGHQVEELEAQLEKAQTDARLGRIQMAQERLKLEAVEREKNEALRQLHQLIAVTKRALNKRDMKLSASKVETELVWKTLLSAMK